MKGSINLIVRDGEDSVGVEVNVNLQSVSILDKALLLNSFLKGIGVKDEDLDFLVMLSRVSEKAKKSEEAI